MAEVIFNYNGIFTVVQCKEDDLIKDITKCFCQKIKKDKSGLIFLYDGNKLNEESTFIQGANNIDKERKKMAILVSEINPDPEPVKDIIEVKQILCPECGETIKIKIIDYKVKLFGCKNGHKYNKSLEKSKALINYDDSKIVCDLCKEIKKSETFQKIFYFCFTCKQKFCPMCKSKHEKKGEHKIIEYDLKNCYCNEHKEPYNSFCENCKKNICLTCIEEHSSHDIINYQNILAKKDEKLKELNNLRIKINKLKDYMNEVIHIFQEIIKNYDILYDIQMNIINSYNIKSLNYELLYNINEIDNSNYFGDLDRIIDDNTRISDIFEIYKCMDEKNKIFKKKVKI